MASMISHEEDEENSCPGCGASQSLWTADNGNGFVAANGDVYCCAVCASGKTCNCNIERSETLVKRRSA